ncbi:DUF983 domain-containing protein [Erythrobacter sp. HKB08]|uniref:DUF983 domain-containing protein n=1 Tax=Erythrobacter sp. HKB08 TaxID=2502843 RepID=UPI001009303D
MPSGLPDNSKGQPGQSPDFGSAALFGLCPSCGERTLFDGVARFADRCSNCGLEFSRFNVGDGPAAFLTLIVGGLVTILAVWLELAVSPPFWVHALIWIPLVAVLVVGGLRVAKAALLFSEYRNRAREAGSKE